MGFWSKTQRCSGNSVARVSVEKFMLVEEHESLEYDGGHQKSHDMETHCEMAQSRKRLGPVRLSHLAGAQEWCEKEQMCEQDGHARLRDSMHW